MVTQSIGRYHPGIPSPEYGPEYEQKVLYHNIPVYGRIVLNGDFLGELKLNETFLWLKLLTWSIL